MLFLFPSARRQKTWCRPRSVSLQQAISNSSGMLRDGAVRETYPQPVPARHGTDPVTQAQAMPLHSCRTEAISHHERYVDAQEGAAFLGLHPKTLMRLAREGEVSAYSISDGPRRHWRFLISELDTWMRSRVNSSPHPVRPRPADERRK